MSSSQNTSFPPSNCQTISEFKITRGYNVQNRTIRKNASSSSTKDAKTNNGNNEEVEICMQYDRDSLDAGRGFGIGDNDSVNKKFVQAFISAITYDQSDFHNNSYNEAPCSVNFINTNNWVWKEAITNGTAKASLKDKYENTIGIPPRTQSLCLGNLKEINVNDLDKDNGNSYLLMEWIIAAKLEGQKLANQYKNDGDIKKLCKALGYSYADYGDLIKGTNIWENYFTKELEENLKNIFKTVFKNHIQQNGKTSSSNKYPENLTLLRETWWNTNKKYILGALIVGAETSTGNNDSSCVEKMKISPPTIDYIPQFLRFAQEWVETFCYQRKIHADHVVSKCKTCVQESKEYHKKSNVDENRGKVKYCLFNNRTTQDTIKCEECKNKCEIFKTFVENKANKDEEKKKWRDRWQQMEHKYRELIKDAKEKIEKYKETLRQQENQQQIREQHQKEQQQEKQPTPSSSSGRDHPYMTKCGDNGNECLKPYNDSFYQYLAYNGYTTLNSYMNMVLKDVDCGEDKPRWDYATAVKKTPISQSTGNKLIKVFYPQFFGSTPTGYQYACECRIPSREELCRDNHMYNTRWVCGQNGVITKASRTRRIATTGKQAYELCRLRHDESDEADQTSTRGTYNAPPNSATLNEEDITFFNSFDSWYKDIQDKLDRHFHRISRDCKLENIGSQNGGNHGDGIISQECQTCRDSCECYKLWVKNMKQQWGKQKENYGKFETKSHGQKVPLNDYLFTRCWGEYFEKDLKSKKLMEIDSVEDIQIISLLRERCGEDKEKGQEKFQERINKAESGKTICDKKQQRCQKTGNALTCDMKDVYNCEPKTYDDTSDEKKKKWICTQNSNGKLDLGACVPPRTQTLCVANMYDGKNILINNVDKDKLKDYIKNAMKKETELLYEYYKDGKPIVTKKDETDPNGLPKNFCRAAKRTYNDFKHMVIGDIPWKPDSFKKIHEKSKEILENNKGTHNPNGEISKNWWDTHSDEFWEAVKCGIKNKTKPNNSVNFSGDECGEFPPEDTDDPFVWWFKEWGQQFCVERQKYIDDINKVCVSSENSRCPNSGGKKELIDGCKTKCDAYKTFIEEKKEAWNKQKKKYETENPGVFARELLGLSYPECLGSNFDQIFEEEDPLNGKPSTGKLKYIYGDASDICSCTEQIYTCNNNKSSCRKKSGDLITWRTHLLKKGKDGKQLQGVYVPPRRQKLCLANLYPINFGKSTRSVENNISRNKNTLLNRLKIVAEREAFYLWKHVTKDEKDATSLHNKACCAIRNSFFDIGDIVKGTDLWDDPSKKYIDKYLKDIFGKDVEEAKRKKNTSQFNTIPHLRKQWWDEKRNSVWDAMQCGVTNALKDLKARLESYDKIDCMKDINNQRNVYLVATPQFVRWLEEWTQQFCEEYKIYFGEVQSRCTDSVNNNDCNDNSGGNSCKDACTTYNDWITSKKKEWDGMSKYYENVKGKDENSSADYVDYGAVSQPTSIDYLNQECKNEINGTNHCCYCNDVGTLTSSHSLYYMDKVVNKIDDKYKTYIPQCTKCYIQHIKDQIEKISKALKHRDKEKDKGSNSSAKSNPCTKKHDGVTTEKTVIQIAQDMQQAAKTQWTQRDVGSNLKGNIENAKFKSEKTLGKDEVCNLDKTKHTNDGRRESQRPDGPCQGKGGGNSTNTRFEIGTQWEPKDSEVNTTHQGVLLSLRRRHMCTSNLENLDTSALGLTGAKVNDSFLGDVLLSAKEEANKIIDMYKEKNNLKNAQNPLDPNHQATICGAVRSSFSDLGDIIRGRDVWTGEQGNKQLQDNLEKIFGKIKDMDSIKDKYDSGSPKYLELRSDWWIANRDQVWKAMKCATTSSNIQCDNDTPPDDYIPQRLRWMTEWAEWFCKAQNKHYMVLMGACDMCKGVSKGTPCANCKECKDACGKYRQFIDDWKRDWGKMEINYSELYKKASGNNGNDENEKYLDKFLKQLNYSNTRNDAYSTAEGYVHQELKNMDCVKQTQFCKKNSSTPSSAIEDTNYAFKYPPHDYEQECNCTEPAPTPPYQPQPGTGSSGAPNGEASQKDDICDKVKQCIEKNEQKRSKNKDQGDCNPKYDSNKTPNGGYPVWDCDGTKFQDGEGPCMPPRRQKLCIHHLEYMTAITQDDLKEPFMKCAAIETFLDWKYFIKHGGGKNSGAEAQLKTGKIPEEFKRIMIYTLGDFRDLCLGTDISANLDERKGVGKVKKKITGLFNKQGQDAGQPNRTQRQELWQKIEKEVWEGMLCALSYSAGTDEDSRKQVKKKLEKTYGYNDVKFSDSDKTPLSKFAERPQFLRWMTEWGEQYCVKQKEEYEKVRTACGSCKVTSGSGGSVTCNNCDECKSKCTKYKDEVEKWEQEWIKQSGKYKELYEKINGGSKSTVTNHNDDEVVQYLKEKTKSGTNTDYATAGGYLKQEGYISDCVEQTEFNQSGGNTDYAFREYPNTYDEKCECVEAAATKPSGGPDSVTPGQDPTKQDTNTSQSGQPPSVPGSSDPNVVPGGQGTNTDPGTTPGGTGGSSSTTSLIEPPKNMNCVEKAANKIREEAKNINNDLKGDRNNIISDCDKFDKVIQTANGTITIDEDQLEAAFPSNGDSCDNNGKDRLDVEKKWNCYKINRRHNNLCLPPRREHMCIKKIKNMYSSTVDDKDKLFEEVMEAAKEEGIDILRKLKPQKETEFSEICDAMKYSFADIGDIIRGRDLWNNNRTQQDIQTRLQNIFRNIYDKLETDKRNHYQDGGNFYKLREAWWNTNREDIWKAMTCVAPDDEKFLQKDPDNSSKDKLSNNPKCGYMNATPVDDYIPQRFRWMQEWSENFCKGKKKKLDELELQCGKCHISGSSCEDDTDGTKCKECKETCESLSKFVQEWKEQFNKQSKIYKDLYDKANNSSGGTTSTVSTTSTGRRNPRNVEDDEDNKRTNNFLKKVKEKCDDKTKTAEEYLDKTNNCTEYKFDNSNKDHDIYAFKEQPPNGYEKDCECEIPDPLDKCPDGNMNNKYENVCKSLYTKNVCYKKRNNNDLDYWSGKLVRDNSGDNFGVLLPPRRKELCLRNISSNFTNIKSMDDFKRKITESAFSEGYFLWNKLKHDKERTLQAMKYSFYDYGDIIKGTDLMEKPSYDIKTKLEELLTDSHKTTPPSASGPQPNGANGWWDQNKKKVWHAMLYGYKSENNNYTITSEDCNVPNTDTNQQFLRWMTEWSRQFCEEKKTKTSSLQKICLDNDRETTKYKTHKSYKLNDPKCLASYNTYKDWIRSKNDQWESWKQKYQKELKKKRANDNIDVSISTVGTSPQPQKSEEISAEKYIESKCERCKCNINSLDKMYEQIQDANIKSIKNVIEKVQEDIPELKPPSQDYIFKSLENVLQKVTKVARTIEKKIYPSESQIKRDVINADQKNAKQEKTQIQEQRKKPNTSQPSTSSEISLTDVLTYTLPVRIGFLLCSAAFLFYYLKKKPKLGPTKLFRVIDIPQNDYGIPDETSTNRYVPYGRYNGKTYIYVERDGDNGDDKYMFTSDTTDVTSSESEYEEMDINDIYPYKSPKYKTLIEVVLKPSRKTYDTRDNHIYHMENTQDTHHTHMDQKDDSNKITNNEWNIFKNDFISNILQNTQMNLPNKNTTYDDMYKDTQPDDNILCVNKEEKPFISKMQDRDLHNNELFTYNINWNVPEIINRTTNIMNDLKYFSYDLYSGTDLINDSLNDDQHVDIYGELLKRKEKELFEGKHPQNIRSSKCISSISDKNLLEKQI